MTERVDCVVIGAGVVGLAIARALAQTGQEVLVLEAKETIGTGISSRSSGVIHAGIYYPQGSAKARWCLEGRRLLYEYCATHSVEHRRCGKLIVATDRTQLPRLEAIKLAAHANGVTDVRWLDGAEAREMEPALSCVAALHSPSSGIVDSHGLMLSLQGDIQRAGGSVVCQTPLLYGHVEPGATRLHAGTRPEDLVDVSARVVINSAGLDAQNVARRLGVPETHIPPLHYAKGNYFSLQCASPFAHLIYPLPEPDGLGVHLTLDLAGQARFGPDVEWIEQIDYAVDPRRSERFYKVIRRYWPTLPDASLQPAYAGIRPKIVRAPNPVADFVFQGPEAHGLPHLINLYGIDSPGLTAALAIGRVVANAVHNLNAPGGLKVLSR